MKTVKTLGLMALMGVAVQLKAQQESIASTALQEGQAISSTINKGTAATSLLGTEGTGNGSTVAAEVIKIGQSFQYVPAANLVSPEGNDNTVGQTIELIGTNLSNNVKTALDTTSLDTLTKSALQVAIDNQIPIIKANLKTAYANFIATQAQKIADKVTAFNKATAETKPAAALALSSTLNAQVDISSLIKPVNDLITIAKNTISDPKLANEVTTAVTNQINNDKQLSDLGKTLIAEALPAAINTQVQQTIGSDMQTIANSVFSYISQQPGAVITGGPSNTPQANVQPEKKPYVQPEKTPVETQSGSGSNK